MVYLSLSGNDIGEYGTKTALAEGLKHCVNMKELM